MLSVENPLDPSCSSKISGIKNHERVSEKLAFEEADLACSHLDDETKLPKFSIRDYVVSARTKDIGSNWPFQQQYLQIFSKHGVKDILPPFEPPDSVRARCYSKKVGSDQLVACVDGEKAVTATDSIECEQICNLDKEIDNIKNESSPQTDGSALGSSDGEQVPESEVCNKGFDKKDKKHRNYLESLDAVENTVLQEAEIASTLTSYDWIDGKTLPEQNLPSSLPEPNGMSEDSVEQFQKESNLIENLYLIPETSRNEETVSNLSSLSEPMASKVCPVCKAFMSSSNTTLNAHIDQCLKVESTSKSVGTNQIKHKIKPRKKRSMVDICATAPQCTLEDLDRRNGTNWAENSNWFPSNGDLCEETKRQRVSPINFMGEDDENAVYVDSNGTKLLILSKLNDDLEPRTRDEIKQKKHLKDSNKETSSSGCNSRKFAPNNSKGLKVKPYSKKLSSLKTQNNEILEALKEASCVGGGSKEKSLSGLRKARAGTLRQWVCSKRSILPKQLVNNGIKDIVLSKQHSGIKFNQLKEDNSSKEENHILKISRSLGNSDPFPGFKKSNNQLNPEQKTDKGRKVSLIPSKKTDDGCILRFTRPSGNYVSSPRSKRVEVDLRADQNAGNVPKPSPKPSRNYCYCLPSEANSFRKNTLLGESDFPRKKKKYNRIKERLIFQKPQNEVSRTGTQEWVEKIPPETVKGHGCLRDSSDFFGSKSTILNKKNGTHKLNVPKNVTRSEIAELADEGSVDRSSLLGARHKLEMRSISQRKEKPNLKGLKCGAKELARNVNMVLVSANESIGDIVVKSNKSSRGSAQIDQFDIQDCAMPVHGSETRLESEMPSFCSNQETLSEEITDVFPGIKDHTEAAINARLEKSLSGIDNSGSNSTHDQGLETSFPKQGDTEFEDSQNEPSIRNATSSPQDTSRSLRGLSLEPSVISSDTNCSQGESTKFASDYELSSGMIITDAGRMRLGQEDFKGGSAAPEKEPVEISDNQICHSRKEYVCQEKVPLSKLSCVTKSLEEHISWQDPRNNEIVIPNPESHMGLITMKENSDSVMKLPASISQDLAMELAQCRAPSSSNPILRLMGKNLMVASKDEEESNQLRGFSNGKSNNHQNSKYLTLLGFGQDLSNPVQNFVGISKNFGNHCNPQIYPPTDAGNQCEMYMGGFAASGAGLNGKSIAQTQQKKPNKKPNSAFAFNPPRRHQIPVSNAQTDISVQEVIVIDDSPELEANSSTVFAGFSGSRVNQSSQIGTSPTILSSRSKPIGTFSCLPPQSAFAYKDPPAGLGPNFVMSCPGMNIDLGKRGSSSEGSGVLLPNTYILPSVSTGRMNPALFYSQRLW